MSEIVYYIRNNRRLRFFVPSGSDIKDITGQISDRTKNRFCKDGFISVPGTGFDPIDGIKPFYPSIEFIRIYESEINIKTTYTLKE
jgi:hypothetical protein